MRQWIKSPPSRARSVRAILNTAHWRACRPTPAPATCLKRPTWPSSAPCPTQCKAWFPSSASGTRAAIVLTAGLNALYDNQGRTIKQAVLDAARSYVLRLLGPNCVGMLVPSIGLNTSFAHMGAKPGKSPSCRNRTRW